MPKLADEPENPLHKLSDEQLEAIGREFDELHEYVKEDLGERDAKYIRSIIELHRRLGLIGRAELLASTFWPTWILGTATLSVAKILENMEIGHNVLHGQWDWMNDPVINSQAWDWDTASTSAAWKHSHNFVHHTYTNIRGKDKDLGYEIMRIDPHQPWHPVYLLQPFYNVLLMMLFEWGVAFHDLDLDAVRSGEKSQKDVLYELKGIWGKAWRQILKDYIAWPLMSAGASAAVAYAVGPTKVSRWDRLRRRGPSRAQHALSVAERAYNRAVAADAAANLIRNLWSYSIIFCGHFPDQTYTFSQEETENETTGGRYVRQLIGAANIEGGPFFHVMSGNLGYQVEHHLYPDMPSTRYGEIAPKVREICERYDLPYNTGPLGKQLAMVHRTIIRLAFPGGKVRPKPGPYRGAEGAHVGRARDGPRGVVGDLSGEASIEIAAPLERCFAIAADIERAPEWQGAMRSARALQRGAGGRPALVETEIDALVAKVTLLLRFDYDEPGGLDWRREGGDLQGLDGAWRFASAAAARTLATYALDIDLNRALALLRKGVRGPAEARVRTLLVDRPLEGLKRVAESA